VEKELFQHERRAAGAEDWASVEGRIPVDTRIMDSRAANKETMQHGESLTLIQIMSDLGDKLGWPLDFISAGRDSGAEAGKTFIKEGVGMINDKLYYDESKVELVELPGHLSKDGQASMVYKFNGKAPTLFFNAQCSNTIFCAQNWTGAGGGENPLKDPIDCVRYAVIADLEQIDTQRCAPRGRGF